MKDNPYVGPRPYTRADRDRFYGRNRESRDLLAKIMAERVVLFYAQSGAGKSSLLNAQIIPNLEAEGFRVLPTARVSSDLPPGIAPDDVDNIFIFSALQSLAGDRVDVARLTRHTLLDFFQEYGWLFARSALPAEPPPLTIAHPRSAQAPPPILICDQFEELFTAHRDRWPEARGFFAQIRAALDALPELGLIFVMREDHIAAVDPYAAMLPRRLRARFRMERLTAEGALEAIQKPAQEAGRPFDEGVAEQLVDNLRRIKGHQGHEAALGPYVEPVQLQVVCSRLWDNLPEQPNRRIRWTEVEQFGNVDETLTDFYEDAVARAQMHASERDVRRWFGERLITPAETRGLVMRDEAATGGLPNAAVDALEATHIIRAEARAGARWYELAHDRLVAPILDSNARREKKLDRIRPWRPIARQWMASGDDPLLYRGRALAEALEYLNGYEYPGEIERYEWEFIHASRAAEDKRKRRRQIRTAVTAIAGIVALIMAILAQLAYQGQREAQIAYGTAEAQRIIAVNAEATAVNARATAEARRVEAEEARAVAVAERERAEEQARIATSRQLAAQSLNELNGHNPDLALLLAIEAVRKEATLEALSALRTVLAQPQGTIRLLQHETSVSHARWDHAEARIATFNTDGQGWIWDAATGERILPLDGSTASISMLEAAWSPDDARVAAVSLDGMARVWAADTGDLVLETPAHQGYAYTLAWAPGSDRLATTGGDALARVWDLATGESVLTLTGHAATISVVAWHPQEARDQILTTSWDGAAAIWDATTGERTITFTGHTDALQSAAWSPDGTRVLSAGRDTVARIWDAATGEEIAALVCHAGQIRHAAWNHAGTQVLTMGDDMTARVWDAETGAEVFLQLGHTDRLFTGGWSPDDRYILTAGWDGLPRVWDAATGHQVVTLIGHTRRIAHATWSADGARILTDSSDHTARVWELARARQPAGEWPVIALAGSLNAAQWHSDGEQILLAGDGGLARLWDQDGEPILTFDVQGADVLAAAWNHAEDAVATADRAGVLRRFDAPTGAQVISLTGHTDYVHQLAWSPDDTRLLSASSDDTARIWDAASGKEIAVLAHEGQVNCAVWHPQGNRILTCSEDGAAALWDAATGERQLTFEGHGAPVTSGRWNAAGDRLLTTSMDKTALVWDATTGDVRLTLEGHTGWLTQARWNADESLILTTATDGAARLWDAQTGKCLRVLEGHTGEVVLARWNADESRILTASKDGTARVWATGTEAGNALAVLSGHTGAVITADWNPTGTRILTAGEDGVARQFHTQIDDLIAAACARTLRQMTPEEWRQIMKDQGAYRPTCE
ncbi:MAG: hypothetical protein ACLFTI_04820 [Anaerolineales bacterium]